MSIEISIWYEKIGLLNPIRDTNFFSHTIRMKLPVLESAMDCLFASVNIIVTSCVMA